MLYRNFWKLRQALAFSAQNKLTISLVSFHFLIVQSLFKDETFRFISCKRLWWDLRKQRMNLGVKVKWQAVKMWAITVLMWYIDTLVPRQLKSSWVDSAKPVHLADKQLLSCTSVHIMFLQVYPSLLLPLKAKRIVYSSIRKACVYRVRLLGFREAETKISVQSNHTALAKHLHILQRKQVLLLVFVINLEYTVNLKPLILSVSPSFHHGCDIFSPHSTWISFNLLSMSGSVIYVCDVNINSYITAYSKAWINITD